MLTAPEKWVVRTKDGLRFSFAAALLEVASDKSLEKTMGETEKVVVPGAEPL